MKLRIPEKHGKSRIPNFCYIQVIVFDLSYLPVAAVGMLFPGMLFPGILNLTVGILLQALENRCKKTFFKNRRGSRFSSCSFRFLKNDFVQSFRESLENLTLKGA